MSEEEKLTRMAQISMLANKIGNLLMNDQMSMPDNAFAFGVAMNAIMQAAKDRGISPPEKAELDLAISFMRGLASTTAVSIRSK